MIISEACFRLKVRLLQHVRLMAGKTKTVGILLLAVLIIGRDGPPGGQKTKIVTGVGFVTVKASAISTRVNAGQLQLLFDIGNDARVV